jgi:hypothetical protein
LILDKGCLDTFIFRSSAKPHGALIESVLNNLQSWLKSPSSSSNCISSSKIEEEEGREGGRTEGRDEGRKEEGGEGGVYMILSPRGKFKSIRDYCGFSRVDKHSLNNNSNSSDDDVRNDGDKIQLGAIETSNSASLSKARSNSQTYLFVCHKNGKYSRDDGNAFKMSTMTTAGGGGSGGKGGK